MRQRKKFRFSCVDCCDERSQSILDQVIENSKEIKYETFILNVDKEDLKCLFPFYESDARKGLTLKKDWHVNYYASIFNNKVNITKVYLIQHSAIDYIFY